MRAYIDNRNADNIVVIVAQGNAGVRTYNAESNHSTKTVTVDGDLAPGVYRASVNALSAFRRCNVWGFSAISVGAKVDLAKEADRLQAKSDGAICNAHTLSPGIQGYDQRGQASQASQVANKKRNRQLAAALRSLNS